MRNKLNLSQIFLPNYKQALNFVSLYEELIKPEDVIQLFILVEVKGDRRSPATKKQDEFEKLTRAIAKSLKTTYLEENSATEMVFEKALTNINNQLSILARKGLVGWYKKLNALVGVYAKNTFFLSVTGSCAAFLLRKNEFSKISEGLAGATSPHPLKTFSNFSSGALNEGDFIILSTSSLYNYVSLDKIRLALTDGTLNEAGADLIATLKQDALPDEAFATLLAKASGRLELPDSELHPLMSPSSHTIIEDREALSESGSRRFWRLLANFVKNLWLSVLWTANALTALAGKIIKTTAPRRRTAPQADVAGAIPPAKSSKKSGLLWAFAVLAILLVINIAFFNLRNNQKQAQETAAALLEEASLSATDAEAALIYGDQNKAIDSLRDARQKTEEASQTADLDNFDDLRKKSDQVLEKISKLTDQINKVTVISQTETVAQFTSTPDRLIKFPAGFVGFNSFTNSFEVFDGNSVRKVSLAAPIPESLVSGAYLSQIDSMIFAGTMGNFYKLNSGANALEPLYSTSSKKFLDKTLVGLNAYSGRFYTVDKTNSQIQRIAFALTGAPAEIQDWLKAPFDFSDARDLSVDGNIFVLLSDSIVKFTKGEKQNFDLAGLSNPLKNAERVFTEANYQYLYVLDPENSRIVIFTKQGTLATQLTGDIFSDLKDLWADEPNKLLYVLNGNELLRFRY